MIVAVNDTKITIYVISSFVYLETGLIYCKRYKNTEGNNSQVLRPKLLPGNKLFRLWILDMKKHSAFG